jgi:hypothetical protein
MGGQWLVWHGYSPTAIGGNMKYKYITTILRWIFTSILVVFSYQETGPATALCLALIFLGMEATDFILRKQKEIMLNILNIMMKITKRREERNKNGTDNEAKGNGNGGDFGGRSFEQHCQRKNDN